MQHLVFNDGYIKEAFPKVKVTCGFPMPFMSKDKILGG